MSDKTTDHIPGWQSGEGARGVGVDLRARREALGWSLPDIAGWLRIRETYLLALEEGNMTAFPGTAYALGFLRSYAHALGLDPDEAVARFRHDTRGVLDRKIDLSFPEPVSERGVPVGLWVGAGLAVLVGTYIGYYHFFGGDPAPTHQMPPVAEIMPGVTQHGTTSPQIAAVMPDRGLAPSPQTPAPQNTGTENTGPQASAPPMPAMQGTAPNPAPSGASSESASGAGLSDQSPSGQNAFNQGVSTQTATAAPAGEVNHPGTPSQAVPAPLPASPGAPADQTASNTPPLPEASGAPQAAPTPANMIALHAESDAWVSIKDKAGAIVFSRVLKSGETWQGPEDAAPYRMTLGNAGGLTLSAGDVTTSALGRMGAVRRNLVVTAAAIREGQLGQEGSAARPAANVAPVTQHDGDVTANDNAALKKTDPAPKLTTSGAKTSGRRPGAQNSVSHESETDRLNARQLEQTTQPR